MLIYSKYSSFKYTIFVTKRGQFIQLIVTKRGQLFDLFVTKRGQFTTS